MARVLLHEGEDGKFPFSHEMCAALLGASRSSVNQVLKQLERQAVVRLSYGRIDVLDKAEIARVAGAGAEDLG